MTEEPIFITRSISHYEALLTLNLNERGREAVNRLLAEAKSRLAALPFAEADTKCPPDNEDHALWALALGNEPQPEIRQSAEILPFRASSPKVYGRSFGDE